MSPPKLQHSKMPFVYWDENSQECWCHDGTSWKLLSSSVAGGVVTEITSGRLLRMDLWRLRSYARMLLWTIGYFISDVIARIRARKSS